MKRYGYHRTSTREQHLDRGIKEITTYCEQNNLELEKIFTDQQTGKNFNRPRYQVLKEDVLRAGDELIITEVDRLGRNKQETLKELQYYRDNGIRVEILELPTTLMDLSKLDNAMARMLMETINNMLVTTDPEEVIYGSADVCYHLIKLMKQVGINVVAKTEVGERFAVIDDELVWHGGMNLLGKVDIWDNLMRIKNHQVAAELLEISLGTTREFRGG